MANESAYYRMKKKYFDNKVIHPDFISILSFYNKKIFLSDSIDEFFKGLRQEINSYYGCEDYDRMLTKAKFDITRQNWSCYRR